MTTSRKQVTDADRVTTPAALGVVTPEPEASAAEVWLTHAASAAAEVARAKAALNAAIVAACRGGASYREVAAVVGLSHERVRVIVAEALALGQ